MTGFIANKPEPAAVIRNLPFYPDLSPDEFKDVMRVDQTVTNKRLTAFLRDAMIRVNNELKFWQQKQTVGHLDDVPADSYDDRSELTYLYINAVFHRAKALLIESYRDYDSTKSGHNRADEMEPRIDDHLRISRETIRKIIGENRITVELI